MTTASNLLSTALGALAVAFALVPRSGQAAPVAAALFCMASIGLTTSRPAMKRWTSMKISPAPAALSTGTRSRRTNSA